MQSTQHSYVSPKMAQLRFKSHGVTENLLISYFGVPNQNMQFYAKHTKLLFLSKIAELRFKCQSHLEPPH